MVSFLIRLILFPLKVLRALVKIWVLVAIVFGLIFLLKPLPEGFSVSSEFVPVAQSDVRFFVDKTFLNDAGEREVSQEIFDEVFHIIREAKEYVLVDMFLYNRYQGVAREETRGLAYELTSSLIQKKQDSPSVAITVLTDPVNSLYGTVPSPQLQALRGAGIQVIETNLHALPDSNPIYSGFYRSGLRYIPVSWFEQSLSNPFDPNAVNVPLATYTRLLNFKANHRKVVLADDGYGGSAVLVTSANPHDGSSAHSNVALRVNNALTASVFESEQAVARISNSEIPPINATYAFTGDTNLAVRLLTEEAIRDALVERINQLQSGDTLDMSMFYLSERNIVSAIKDASERGVSVRLLLDQNKDAFGRKKNGVPNKPVAHILTSHSDNVEVRWCDTHGEQCHAKLIITEKNGVMSVFLGSANLTRRNIGGFNLETNVELLGSATSSVMESISTYFTDVWENKSGQFSVPYGQYKSESWAKRIMYYVMENLGTSSF